MNTTKPVTHFTYNHLKKTIVGTDLNFKRAGQPNSSLCKELMARMEEQPDYTFEVVASENKVHKKTYKGLTQNLMIDYLGALAESEGVEHPEKSAEISTFKETLEKMRTDGVTFARRKKVFLEKYPHFDVESAKQFIKDNNFQAMKVHYKIIRLGKPEHGSATVPFKKAE